VSVPVLICAPDHWGDQATDTWAPYEAVYFANKVKQAGYEPVVLRGGDCVKPKYDEAVPQVKAIFGVGHGNETTFTGYMLNVLEKCPVPQGKYDGKCWWPVSCLVGRQLAPEIVQKSQNAVSVGEITEYAFWLIPSREHKGEDPWSEDPLVASFFLSEVTGRDVLLQGKTFGEAFKAMQNKYDEFAKYWDDNNFPEVADTLRYDKNNRVKFGDDNWTISGQPPQPPPPPPPPPPCQYACPFCDFAADSKDKLKAHVLSVHLQPCKLRDTVRKWLGCPIEKLK
jgi:hypothetical protein